MRVLYSIMERLYSIMERVQALGSSTSGLKSQRLHLLTCNDKEALSLTCKMGIGDFLFFFFF